MIFSLFVDKRLNAKTRYPAIVRYSPMLVNDKDRLPSIGASKLSRFLISN